MAQITERIHHIFHIIIFLFAMQSHYSTAFILAYITHSDNIKSENRAGLFD